MSLEKLTKKQQKAAQFRSKAKAVSSDSNDDEDSSDRAPKSKGKERERDGTLDAETEGSLKELKKIKKTDTAKSEKKRKRKDVDDTEEEATHEKVLNPEAKAKKPKGTLDTSEAPKKRTKKLFGEDGNVQEIEVPLSAPTDHNQDILNNEDSKNDKRYIVFVGNMSFTSTANNVAKHFSSHCNETPTVRLLTKKGDPSKLSTLPKSKQKSIAKGKAADPSAPTSKGCAFVEFKSANALQKALQYHHTQFEGRTINVELTAGGGGKGSGRKEKIKKKNDDLEVERQKLHEKYVKNAPKKEGAKSDDKEASSEKLVVPAAPQWGPKAAASSANKQRGTTKVPKWAASGANAVRLSG